MSSGFLLEPCVLSPVEAHHPIPLFNSSMPLHKLPSCSFFSAPTFLYNPPNFSIKPSSLRVIFVNGLSFSRSKRSSESCTPSPSLAIHQPKDRLVFTLPELSLGSQTIPAETSR